MKRYIKIATLALVCLVSSTIVAQSKKIKEANKEYDKLSYVKTSEILLEVVNSGYESAEVYRKLGNSFYFNNKMEEAATWYGKLLALEEDQDPEYYFRYALALKGIEDYKEADKWMSKLVEQKASDLRGLAFASTKDYLSVIDSVSQDVEVINLDINSSYSDFGATEYQGQIIFASSKGGGDIYGWNDQPFLDLYSATKKEDGTYDSIVTPLNEDVNTKFHESSAAFMPDGKTMYFTRNNYELNRYKKSDEGINLLKIFKATLNEEGVWGTIESVHFNSDDYSVAHPAINTKGTKMYFASDMDGSFGASDIFEVAINEDGTLGDPVNLGAQVNTEASETFPFINSKGDLYYSSNGLNGLGGLDVFVIRDFENKGSLSQDLILENLGRPVNSSKDDFGYVENLKTKDAFFTSNRDGGKGDDDIYNFEIPKCLQNVTGLVKNKETLELLPNTLVSLLDELGNKIDSLVVGQDAMYEFKDLVCEKEYVVRGEKTGYLTDEKSFTVPFRKQKLVKDLLLQQYIEPCVDLAKVLDIPIIYFELAKWNITPEAAVHLQKIIDLLNKYPTATIAIKSHTDCRGSARYNEKLSDNRAKSTRKYLISQGIDKARIVAKGYGESKLLNDCACEGSVKSTCTEEVHQLNRRSEFIITGIDGKVCDEE